MRTPLYIKFEDVYRQLLRTILKEGEKKTATRGTLLEVSGIHYRLHDGKENVRPFILKLWNNYMSRIEEHLWNVVDMLNEKPTTKNAFIPIIYPNDPDYPCLAHIQFMVMDDQLEMLAVTRSSDVWMMFPYDVASLIEVFDLVAAKTEMKKGVLHHTINSAHFYEDNIEDVKAFLEIE